MCLTKNQITVKHHNPYYRQHYRHLDEVYKYTNTTKLVRHLMQINKQNRIVHVRNAIYQTTSLKSNQLEFQMKRILYLKMMLDSKSNPLQLLNQLLSPQQKVYYRGGVPIEGIYPIKSPIYFDYYFIISSIERKVKLMVKQFVSKCIRQDKEAYYCELDYHQHNQCKNLPYYYLLLKTNNRIPTSRHLDFYLRQTNQMIHCPNKVLYDYDQGFPQESKYDFPLHLLSHQFQSHSQAKIYLLIAPISHRINYQGQSNLHLYRLNQQARFYLNLAPPRAKDAIILYSLT